jgi:hypothetical protein
MKLITRRRALGIYVATASEIFALGRPHAAKAVSVAREPLSALVELNGVKYLYKEDQGKDLGDFVSDIGGFTQACIRSDVAGFPLTVFFRPDRTSDRIEVVFELGRLFDNPTAAHIGPYTITIFSGDRELAHEQVAEHYWHSRWRWQSAPRPVIGKPATLIEQNLLPPYVRSGNQHLPPPVPYSSYQVMGLAGVTAYMPGVGERPDIGLLTEPQAQYVCTGDAGALQILRAQAEAAGTVPWHMRDENTSAPIDFRKYPKACWYQDQKLGEPFVLKVKSPVTVDGAHQPALAYLPYLLTGDPYLLEELQFQATWNYGSCSLTYRPTLSETRQFAWDIRTLGQCARITPATVPSWLMNQAYWIQLLGVHRRYFETTYVESSSPAQAIFRATDNIDARPADGKLPAGTWCEPWESEFLASVFGWLVSMGLSEWRKSFDWVIAGTVARTDNSSGWIRARSTPYEMMLRAGSAAPFATTWAEAWSLNHSTAGLTYDDPNTWVPPDMTYLTYTRGALVYAERLGVTLTDNLTWATSQLNAGKWKTAYKWRLGTGLA